MINLLQQSQETNQTVVGINLCKTPSLDRRTIEVDNGRGSTLWEESAKMSQSRDTELNFET